MLKKILLIFFIFLFSSTGARALQAGISVDFAKDVGENVIYSVPVNFSRLPGINYSDIGYLVRFKPVDMLSAVEIAGAKALRKPYTVINQGYAVPSVYNISFENGGEINGEDISHFSPAELVRKNPAKTEYIYAYAVMLKNEGKLKEAAVQVDKALQLNYNYALGHFLKGDILRMAGNFKDAAREYSITLEINPYCTDAYFNIAKMLEIYGQNDLALNYYKMAYDVSPNDLEIRNQILKLSRKGA